MGHEEKFREASKQADELKKGIQDNVAKILQQAEKFRMVESVRIVTIDGKQVNVSMLKDKAIMFTFATDDDKNNFYKNYKP